MTNNLSLTAANGNLGIIECPVCKQTIDASSTQCRFCSVPLILKPHKLLPRKWRS